MGGISPSRRGAFFGRAKINNSKYVAHIIVEKQLISNFLANFLKNAIEFTMKKHNDIRAKLSLFFFLLLGLKTPPPSNTDHRWQHHRWKRKHTRRPVPPGPAETGGGGRGGEGGLGGMGWSWL